MLKIVTTFLLCIILLHTLGQKQRKVSTYLFTQYNSTIYDATVGNNPSGIGLGLQSFFTVKPKFKITIELTGDIYLQDDKVYRMYPNGTPINDVNGMVNLFAGSLFHPIENMYLSFAAGPSFINGQTLLGIKPALGFYISANHRWIVKAAYINVFNRDKITKKDFGSVSLAIGLKLF